jgi:hypothetical protein
MPIPDELREKLTAQLQRVAGDLRAAARAVDGVRFPSLARMTHDYAKTIQHTELEAFPPEMWALLVANGCGLMRIARDCASLPDASAELLEVRRTARELRDAWRRVPTIPPNASGELERQVDQARAEQALQLLDQVGAFADAWRTYDLATEAAAD